MRKIKDELVVNKTQFNRIAQQYCKELVKFNKLSINKDSSRSFYINK